MPNFISQSDGEVINYLIENFDDIGVGPPAANLRSRLLGGIASGSLVIEGREDAFAIVARANRKHSGLFAGIEIPPQSDLLFVLVTPDGRGKGAGSRLIEEIKAKYMDGQAMVVVCAGERRRRLFEATGFREIGQNDYGHYVMSCEACNS